MELCVAALELVAVKHQVQRFPAPFTRPCGRHGIDEKCVQNIVRETYLECIGVNGKVALKWKYKGRDRIHRAEDKDQWMGLLNTVINFRVS